MRGKTQITILSIAALAFFFAGITADVNEGVIEAGQGMEWMKVGMVMDIANPGPH